ncbi:hypothetical protein ACFSQP_03595 [Bizionia sediminis]|uniref:DUF4168 domain-containing protein n=1 Tax=Bizionia sediminis TaxID=1737064 RepID=A0ABW5KRD6_9FLAO
MKTILFLITCVITMNVFSQDPMLQKNNLKLDEQAKALTRAYSKELALSGEQIGMFENKVEEFLIRAEKIKATYQGRQKLRMLYALQTRETAEMDNILTQPQWELYKKIKPELQPLVQVKTESESN